MLDGQLLGLPIKAGRTNYTIVRDMSSNTLSRESDSGWLDHQSDIQPVQSFCAAVVGLVVIVSARCSVAVVVLHSHVTFTHFVLLYLCPDATIDMRVEVCANGVLQRESCKGSLAVGLANKLCPA